MTIAAPMVYIAMLLVARNIPVHLLYVQYLNEAHLAFWYLSQS